MYNTSTQKKYWRFKSEADLEQRRLQPNHTFIQKHGQHLPHDQKMNFFLSAQEERIVIRYYEGVLFDFCKAFAPPMPNFVKGTAFTYMKRFYLTNTVMDYHPRDIIMVCVYLACKTEEFYVSITQFISNIPGDQEEAKEFVLANELLLLQQLNFHLVVHNPYVPLEGFLVDLKTLWNIQDTQPFAVIAHNFLDKILLTDACLLYAPSQIALAALLHAASELRQCIDKFVTDVVFKDQQNLVPHIIKTVINIRLMSTMKLPEQDHVNFVKEKLERCRNPANNPRSALYKERKQKELLDKDEELDEFLSNAAKSSAEPDALNMSVDE